MGRVPVTRVGVVALLAVLGGGSTADAHTLADTTAPSVVQPADVTVVAGSGGSANVSFTVDATDPDNAESTLTMHCSWGAQGKQFTAGATSQTFNVGTWTLSCYASDPAGNTSSTVTFKINVAPAGSPTGDTTAPSVVQPADVTVVAGSGGSANVSFTVDATDPDNAESTLTMHCSWGTAGMQFTAGSTSETFNVGTWTLSCYASDPAGNTSSTVTFKINVAPAGSPTGDTTAPSVVQPADVTVGGGGPANVSFTVDATDPDNAESTLTMHCSWGAQGKQFTAGATSQTFNVGTWTLSCYASDPAGNTSSAVTFTINVTQGGSGATSGGSSAGATGGSTTGGGSPSTTGGGSSSTGGASTTGGGSPTTTGGTTTTTGSPTTTTTAPAAPAPAPPPAPIVYGNAMPGSTLTAVPPKWQVPPTHVTYQWQLCKSTGCTSIRGADRPRLKLTPALAGYSVRLVVTATIAGHTETSASKKIAVRRRR